MQCPYCHADSQVVDSRATSDGIRRRRVCAECKRRYTTYERLAPPSFKVIKRSGKTEAFDAEKVVAVLARVCRERSQLTKADLRRMARSLEAALLDEGVKSISSSELMRRLLTVLSGVDEVSYKRLAADYLDENGKLRLAPTHEIGESPQLDLFTEGDAPNKAKTAK